MPSSERDFFDVRAVARNTAFPSPVQSLETPHFRAPCSHPKHCISKPRAVVETAAYLRPMPSSGTWAPGLDLSPNIMVMRVAARPTHDLEINYITRSRTPHEKQE